MKARHLVSPLNLCIGRYIYSTWNKFNQLKQMKSVTIHKIILMSVKQMVATLANPSSLIRWRGQGWLCSITIVTDSICRVTWRDLLPMFKMIFFKRKKCKIQTKKKTNLTHHCAELICIDLSKHKSLWCKRQRQMFMIFTMVIMIWPNIVCKNRFVCLFVFFQPKILENSARLHSQPGLIGHSTTWTWAPSWWNTGVMIQAGPSSGPGASFLKLQNAFLQWEDTTKLQQLIRLLATESNWCCSRGGICSYGPKTTATSTLHSLIWHFSS